MASKYNELIWINLFINIICLTESKKLSFLFGNNDLNHSYCPFKHYSTTIKDLCFFFYKTRKHPKSAQEICKKNSHRLATIDNNLTWIALKYSIDQFYTTNNYSYKNLNNRFHMGSVYKMNKQSYFWNHSQTKIEENYFCFSKLNKTFSINSNFNCIELIYNDEIYQSFHDKKMCLKLIDCSNARFSICEWRGDNIQDYSVELRSQIINAYKCIICVASLYCLIWILLWLYHKKKFDNKIMLIMNDYLNELRLFNLNLNNAKDV